MITRQFSYFVIGVFSITSASALPPPSDLAARSKRSDAPPRATTVATPAPAVRSTSTDSSSSESRPSTVVVIDAGHGGFDRGGIAGQRVPEKTMNLDVALRLRALLQASGYRVVMTRDTDVFVPLGTRVAIANQYRNGIFVCIHFNSASRAGASGIETYFYSSQSLPLASAIHYRVAGGAPSSNRGVRRRGFFVLRRTTIPSVLVECGFLTNPTEANYAQSASYQQKLAEEIASGIRGRGAVSSSTRVAVAGTVPLQPFLDQTRVRDSDLRRSKRSRKSSRGKSSKHRMSAEASAEDTDSTKKKSAKKHSSQSDDEHGSAKKKSSSKDSEN